MRSSTWSTQITVATIIASLAPSFHARSAGLTPMADDAQWMNKGVWTARLRDRQVLPDTIRRLGPKDTFFQPTMHPKGTSVVFWGREDGTKDVDIWLSGIEGSQCRRPTSDGQSEGPSWSPDGRCILCSSQKGASYSHIRMMDADGQNQRQQLSPTHYRAALAWQVQDVLTSLTSIKKDRSLNAVRPVP